MLNEILTQLIMRGPVFNLPVCLKKCLNAVCVPARPDGYANIFTMIMLCEITEHVMIFAKTSLFQKRAGPQTIANIACITPNALSMSFSLLLAPLRNA